MSGETTDLNELHRPSIVAAEATMANFRHPERNEDAALVIVTDQGSVFAVFDGVGGSPGGDVAANLTKEVILEETLEWRGVLPALKKAQETLLKKREEKYGYSRMDTTALVLEIKHLEIGGLDLWMANFVSVGDSQLYLVRGGRIMLLTPDRRLEQKVQAGRISKEEARNLPDICSWETFGKLGETAKEWFTQSRFEVPETLADFEEVAAKTQTLKTGDVLLLLTDGFDNLTRREIWDGVDPGSSPEDIAKRLVQRAFDKSKHWREGPGKSLNPRAKPDDITAVVCRVNFK